MWKDTTRYSQDDKERTPTTWTAKSGQLAVTVTCGHIYHRPEWIMHCRKLGINTYLLANCKTKEDAQQRGLAVVKDYLDEMQSHVELLAM